MNMWLPITVLLSAGLLSSDGFVLVDTDIERPSANDFIKILHDYAGNKVVKYSGPRDEPYYPCPAPADILPCVCTPDPALVAMDMDCSAATTNAELIAAFNAPMSFNRYRSLTIKPTQPPSELTVLNSLSFGPCSFEIVHISNTAITEIQDSAFDNSHITLTVLDLSQNKIHTFPFESITNYLTLTNLNLDTNKLQEVKQIQSGSLEQLHLQQNPGLTFKDGLFVSAPLLNLLDLSRCDIQQLTGNMFAELTSLKTLKLGTNKLSVLEPSSIAPPGDTLVALHLSGNNISDVKEGAITGLSLNAEVFLENNQIVELPELVWKPLAEPLHFEAIKLSGNPLRCGCDMEWMYRQNNYFQIFEKSTTCSDGYPIYEIPSDIFDVHCRAL